MHINRERPAKLTYNLRELIEVTGLGRTTLMGLLKTGDLVRMKVGSRTLITAASVDAFIARQLLERIG